MSFIDGLHPRIPFNQAKWSGGVITPEVVVLHDTAGPLDAGSSRDYLRENDQKVSVHFVLERDGGIEQQVRVGHRANHAGRSNYHGRSGVNDFSVGIEIVNPGRMTRFSATEAQAWYGRRFDIEEHGIQEIETPQHGRGLWMPYTEVQLTSLRHLLRNLFESVPTLTDITTHWYISPGRKVDTNPLFPLEHMRSLIFGREDPLDAAEDDVAVDVPGEEFVQIEVPDDALNMRRWPSFNPNVMARIPDGAVVPVIRCGEFGGRAWLKVIYGGHEGWIVARYAAPIVDSKGRAAS